MYSQDEFKPFMARCRELGLPEDARMDDYLEFLETFTSVLRESARSDVDDQIRYDDQYRHEAEPTEAERDDRITELTHERLRKCGEKLAKLLMDGI